MKSAVTHQKTETADPSAPLRDQAHAGTAMPDFDRKLTAVLEKLM
ncbi:hypothetical protein [Clostridium sp. AF32-12BH]|nr:hypothetical protein [Clostridium sp. AF32-12BH]